MRTKTSLRFYWADVFATDYGQIENGRALPDLITGPALIKLLRGLRPGFTEFGCHPGYATGLQSMYRSERSKEVHTLCESRVRRAIAEMGVQVSSFHDFKKGYRDAPAHPEP
jgi:hypothetical protein